MTPAAWKLLNVLLAAALLGGYEYWKNRDIEKAWGEAHHACLGAAVVLFVLEILLS